MRVGSTSVDDDHRPLTTFDQYLDHTSDGTGLGLQPVRVDHQVAQRVAKRLFVPRRSKGLEYEPGLADPQGPDHANDVPRHHRPGPNQIPQLREALIIYPAGVLVLRSGRPVSPGPERPDGSRCVRCFTHTATEG